MNWKTFPGGSDNSAYLDFWHGGQRYFIFRYRCKDGSEIYRATLYQSYECRASAPTLSELFTALGITSKALYLWDEAPDITALSLEGEKPG